MTNRLLPRQVRNSLDVNLPGTAARVLLALLIATFLLGGGSRGDIASLVILRPIASATLVYAVFEASRSSLRGFTFPITLLCLWVILVALQLLPLPPTIWTGLPGREPIVTAFEALGQAPGWQPLSVVPSATINALMALLLPLAVLVLFAVSSPPGRERALETICLFALISALFGIFQVVGGGGLYPYAISNEGMPIGFFSNRNHQAAVIAATIPMILAAAANRASSRQAAAVLPWIARALCLGLVVVVVMTGSRVGTLLAIATLAAGSMMIVPSIPPLRKPHDRPKPSRVVRLMSRAAVPTMLVLAIVSVFLVVQGTAFERLVGKDGLEDLRFQVLPTVLSAATEGLPLGYGTGTFPWVYQIFEPADLIRPSYLNHAHNDWVELLIEGGIVLPLLVLASAAWFVARCWTLRRVMLKPSTPGDRYRLSAAMGIAVLITASFFDYPLRTPAAAAVLMIFIGQLATPRRK